MNDQVIGQYDEVPVERDTAMREITVAGSSALDVVGCVLARERSSSVAEQVRGCQFLQSVGDVLLEHVLQHLLSDVVYHALTMGVSGGFAICVACSSFSGWERLASHVCGVFFQRPTEEIFRRMC